MGRAHPKAVERLTRDWARMVAYYAFPQEHWRHLRTTNIIESPFAAVRLRTSALRSTMARSTAMGSASSPLLENCAPPDAVYTLLDKSPLDSVHLVTPTDDNRRQAEGMKSLGIFRAVQVEIGEIIVAEVDTARIKELVGADRGALVGATPKR